MSEPSESPRGLSNTWSARIAERYQCILSPELADWFDRQIWKHTGQSEYRESIDPSALLSAAPEIIWPGLMTCDLLPVISNMAGDLLCVRVDRNNIASEVVQWYHGGGDWIPWGNNLAEAIVFDAMIDRLPGPTRRHAIPAEDPRPDAGKHDPSTDPMLRWALEHLPSSVAGSLDSSLSDQQVAQVLLEANVAEVALRCELVLANLIPSKRELLERIPTTGSGISRNDLAQWSFDVDRIPTETLAMLEQQQLASLFGKQDWDSASDHALRVTQLAPDLAWAWDILGYAAERRGDLEAAKRSYRRAAACSVFTDQSIRLQTYWTAGESAKFSIARLLHLCPTEVNDSSYMSLLCGSDIKRMRSDTRAHWIHHGSQFKARGDWNKAHRCFVAAAWDVGAEPIDVYANLLELITETAQRSGQSARAAVAQTHRRCLEDRYGI